MAGELAAERMQQVEEDDGIGTGGYGDADGLAGRGEDGVALDEGGDFAGNGGGQHVGRHGYFTLRSQREGDFARRKRRKGDFWRAEAKVGRRYDSCRLLGWQLQNCFGTA